MAGCKGQARNPNARVFGSALRHGYLPAVNLVLCVYAEGGYPLLSQVCQIRPHTAYVWLTYG